MRIPDACRFTGISRSTLYLLIARGEVEIVKMGAATLVLTESLRELIKRQPAGQLSKTAIPIRRMAAGKSKRTNTDHGSQAHHLTVQRGTMPLFEDR